jgi:predicted dehydrogenase/nucleoside-diphosphate-sugar epimerase
MRRVGLIGAGVIARVHADALKTLRNAQVTAVVDPRHDAAAGLARHCEGAQVFASVGEAMAADAFNCAHVLVPPQNHHDVTLPLLRAAVPVLVEKPLAASAAECSVLLGAATESSAQVGVNQNFVYHPAFVRLRRLTADRVLGRPNFVGCVYNVPLRQLAARQFGHWMFDQPVNLLLEQAVHPLSQIATLAGEIREVAVRAGPRVELAPGVAFHASLDASLGCANLPAQLHFAVGQSFPFWQITVVCDDGVVVADMLANRAFIYGRTRWMDAIDGLASGARTAGAMFGASVRNITAYAAATLHLVGRSDAFFRSMRDSIAAFHDALDVTAKPPIDGTFGAMLVQTCERIGNATFSSALASPPVVRSSGDRYDVAVLGGTGFIGSHVVRRLVADGTRVAVMARSIRNLPAVFAGDAVTLRAGDLRDAQAVRAAIGEAPVVVNLAHGGGGAYWEQVRDAMVGGAEIVARECEGRRLIHSGSIAALYLGPQAAPVTGATPVDPQADERADYARAKAMADRMLLDISGLDLCILRPGVVVGEGSSPFHSALGVFNNEQHCIGWNAGRNPLPFVLVEDVADAIVRAVRAEKIAARCYNLVGDIRPSAREFIADLARAMRRPLRYHPQLVDALLAQEYGKFLIKRVTGRAVAPPSRRDLLSRGLRATFDCGDVKRDLGWAPVADPAQFRERAVLVHAG